MLRVKFASTNQKHYPDMGSEASSVWDFCARFGDVISRGNRWWSREMSVFIQTNDGPTLSLKDIFETKKESFFCWPYNLGNATYYE